MHRQRPRDVMRGQVATYHCWNHCQRACSLEAPSGETQPDLSRRRSWIEMRIAHMVQYYAIDLLEFALMRGHFHLILTTRPDKVEMWSDEEVARRWEYLRHGKPLTARKERWAERRIAATLSNPELLLKVRDHLSNLSFFLARLEDWVARRANKEDGETGHFWAQRFLSRRLEDMEDVADAMSYVALNPVRAGVATTPEEGPFTGFRLRAEAWMARDVLDRCDSLECRLGLKSEESHPEEGPNPDRTPVLLTPSERETLIGKIREQRIQAWRSLTLASVVAQLPERLEMASFFRLADRQGRVRRPGKPGAMDPSASPILTRLRICVDRRMATAGPGEVVPTVEPEVSARTGPLNPAASGKN